MGKQCQNCGRIVEAGALFCAGCGHPVAQKENEISEQIPEEMQEQFAGFAKGQAQETISEQAGENQKNLKPEKTPQELLKEAGSALKGAGESVYQQFRAAVAEERADREEEKLLESLVEDIYKENKERKRKKILKWLEVISWIVGLWIIFMVTTDGFALNVRMSEMKNYPGISVGDAFAERFTNRDWSKEDLDGDAYYTIFKGYDPGTQTNWKVYFKVENESFRVDQIMVDGATTTDRIEIGCLLDYIYTGNLDALQANEALDVLLGSVFLASLLS